MGRTHDETQTECDKTDDVRQTKERIVLFRQERNWSWTYVDTSGSRQRALPRSFDCTRPRDHAHGPRPNAVEAISSSLSPGLPNETDANLELPLFDLLFPIRPTPRRQSFPAPLSAAASEGRRSPPRQDGRMGIGCAAHVCCGPWYANSPGTSGTRCWLTQGTRTAATCRTSSRWQSGGNERISVGLPQSRLSSSPPYIVCPSVSNMVGSLLPGSPSIAICKRHQHHPLFCP